jgi:hypothetical protein
MKNSESKLFKKYKSLIKSGKMTKTEINSMRKALSYFSKSMSKEEKQTIVDLVNSSSIKLTTEHTEQGLNYLKSVAFKSNGSPRNTKDYPFQGTDLEVIQKFKEFRLTGLDEIHNGCGEIMGYRSIWLTKSKNGNSFEYVSGHWQPITIIHRYFK